MSAGTLSARLRLSVLGVLLIFMAMASADQLLERVDFESGLPAGWYLEDINTRSGYDYWGLSSARSWSGETSLYCAAVGDSLPDRYSTYQMASFSKEFDFTGAGCGMVSYWYWLNVPYDQGRDYLKVAYRPVGQSIYQTLLIQQGVSNGWVHITHKLPPQKLELIFYFTSDSTPVYYEGVYLDDIEIGTFDTFYVCYLADVLVTQVQDTTNDGLAESCLVKVWLGSSDVGAHHCQVELYSPTTGQSWWQQQVTIAGGLGQTEFTLDRQLLALASDGLVELEMRLWDEAGMRLWDTHQLILQAPVAFHRPLELVLLDPDGGARAGEQVFCWTGADSPSLNPSVSLQLSADGGSNWWTARSGLPISGCTTLDLALLPPEYQEGEVFARAVAQDMVASLVSDPVSFIVDNSPPQVLGVTPAPSATGLLSKPLVSVHLFDPTGLDPATFGLAFESEPVAIEYTFEEQEAILRWTPETALPHGATFTVRAQAADLATPPNLLDYDWSFTTLSGNTPPTLLGPATFEVTAGEPVAFDLSASDDDQDDLTLQITGLPEGATFENWQLSWATEEEDWGEYPLEFVVTDGAGGEARLTTLLTVARTGPPVVGSLTLTPSQPTTDMALIATAHEVQEGGGGAVTLQWQWYLKPAGKADFTLLGGQSSDTLASSFFARGDTVRCVCTPTDSAQSGAPVEANVTVVNAAPLTPSPRILPDNPNTYSNLYCSGASSDPDGDALTYLAQWYKSLDGGQTFQLVAGQTTKSLSKTLTTKHEVWRCELWASDGVAESPRASADTTILNSVPWMDGLADASIEAGAVLTLVPIGKDSDGDPLAFGLSPVPEGASFSPGTGQLEWLPDESQAGQHQLTFTVTDNDGAQGSRVILVTVTSAAAPVLGLALAPTEPTRNDPVEAVVELLDESKAEYDLNYSWFLKPASTGNWLPLASETEPTLDPGNYVRGDSIRCVCVAFDDLMEVARAEAEALVVNAPPTALSPVIYPTSPTTWSNLYCCAVATDADGDSVSYLVEWYKSTDGGATFELVEGQTTKSLSKTLTTKHDLWRCVIQASDGLDLGPKGQADITILNTPPRLTDPADAMLKVGQLFELQLAVTDPDGDPVTCSVMPLPPGAQMTTRGLFRWTPTSSQIGVWNLIFEANDGDGGISTVSVVFEVVS